MKPGAFYWSEYISQVFKYSVSSKWMMAAADNWNFEVLDIFVIDNVYNNVAIICSNLQEDM